MSEGQEAKRVVNLSQLTFIAPNRPGAPEGFSSKRAAVGSLIGAKKLGYSITVVPPLHKAWPRHSHLVNEEMFFVLEGEGVLRMGVEVDENKTERIKETPIKQGDFICCPAGHTNADAHQIVNTSKDKELKYMCVSTMEQPDICLYPDSDKFGVFAGTAPGGSRDPSHRTFEHLGKRSGNVDYWTDEK